MTTINDLDDFKALDPFFRIIEQGLDGLADGGHFFDLLAEDVVFDYIITIPGYPRHVEGRQAVASAAGTRCATGDEQVRADIRTDTCFEIGEGPLADDCRCIRRALGTSPEELWLLREQ